MLENKGNAHIQMTGPPLGSNQLILEEQLAEVLCSTSLLMPG